MIIRGDARCEVCGKPIWFDEWEIYRAHICWKCRDTKDREHECQNPNTTTSSPD
jgi:hypothetical protein